MTADQTVDHFPAPSSKNKKTYPEKMCSIFPKKKIPTFWDYCCSSHKMKYFLYFRVTADYT